MSGGESTSRRSRSAPVTRGARSEKMKKVSAMRRLRPLLAASSLCAVAAAGAACTSILGVGELPDADPGGHDASPTPDATGGGDTGDAGGKADAGDAAIPDSGAVTEVEGGTLQTLTAMAPALFGTSVAISPDGHWLAVGAPGYGSPSFNGSPDNVGAVFLYERDASGAYQQSTTSGTLVPTDFGTDVVGGEFGQDLAFSVDGTLLAVGEPHSYRFLVPDVGAVFVYGLVEGHGFVRYTPIVPDMPAGTQFGAAVAFGGPVLASAYSAQLYVGAPNLGSTTPASVYSYAFAYGDAGSGAYWGAIDTPDDAGDAFGLRLAATSGFTVLIGAPAAVTASGSGAAYVVDLSGTTVPEAGSHLTLPRVAARSLPVPHGEAYELGAALAATVDGAEIALGAPGQAANNEAPPLGEVFRLTSDGAKDAAAYSVSTPLSGASPFYGSALAIATGSLAVGDPGATVAGSTAVGMVHRYVADLDAQAGQTVQPPAAIASGFFGTSLACTPDGSTLVVGAPGTATVSGHVYIYSN